MVMDATEAIVNGRRQKGRRRYQMMDSINIDGNYEKTKSVARQDSQCEDLPQGRTTSTIRDKSQTIVFCFHLQLSFGSLCCMCDVYSVSLL